MISLRKDSEDERNGERFTLTMQDVQEPGHTGDWFANLTEDDVRMTLRTTGHPDALADGLLQNARAEFLARQQPT